MSGFRDYVREVEERNSPAEQAELDTFRHLHRGSVIFDMDGTLCDVRSVRHYVTGPKRNFDAFHKASLFCPPHAWVADLARLAGRDSTIIVTAREARYERVTRDWLAKHGIEFTALYMRPWGDQRKDAVVKAEILDRIIADGHRPVMAVDDNPSVLAVWERAGLGTIVVPGFPSSTDHEGVSA